MNKSVKKKPLFFSFKLAFTESGFSWVCLYRCYTLNMKSSNDSLGVKGLQLFIFIYCFWCTHSFTALTFPFCQSRLWHFSVCGHLVLCMWRKQQWWSYLQLDSECSEKKSGCMSSYRARILDLSPFYYIATKNVQNASLFRECSPLQSGTTVHFSAEQQTKAHVQELKKIGAQTSPIHPFRTGKERRRRMGDNA